MDANRHVRSTKPILPIQGVARSLLTNSHEQYVGENRCSKFRLSRKEKLASRLASILLGGGARSLAPARPIAAFEAGAVV